MFIQICQLIAAVTAAVCLGVKFGPYVGFGVFFITYALMPYQPRR